MHRATSCFICLCSMVFCTISAQDFPGGFNFYLPPDDASSQRFLPEFPAQIISDFIQIDQEGHFSAEGRAIRFWGINLTTGSCFPLKEKSPWIAARMRKMGINLVRFHHMDNGWTGEEGTIFLRSSGGTRSLDPVALDRFHFLLEEMKKNAVYANINLHVSRTFTESDGVAGADSIWQFAKGITYFDPQLIDLQKEFAQQLLSSKSPYSDLTMVEDPVMAIVEITNENTLYGMWKGDQLRHFSAGGNLMQCHVKMLDSLWHEFLLKKYSTHEALLAAWGDDSEGQIVDDQIQDGGFESGNINGQWLIELHEGAAASIKTTFDQTFAGEFSAQVDVARVTNTSWHIQFKQNGLSMTKDSMYALTFYAKADRNRIIGATFQRDESPWTFYGSTTFPVTTEWQKFQYSLTAPETNAGHLRVSFTFQNETGTVFFDDVSFATPNSSGLAPEENLDSRTVQRTNYAERLFFNRNRVADQAQFYLNIQRSYYQDMYAFLKDTLGVRVPITGTNALVGLADVYMQQDLDFIDDHAYWNHPRFPNEAWSRTDWLINNESLLAQNDLGTMSDLMGGLAMEGKPYTISEYNHPYPNRYHWEMFPVMASYASYHDVDGIMFFNYNDGTNSNWEDDFIDGFFGIHRNNSLMAMSPIFAHAYRNKLIEPAPNVQVMNYDSTFIFNLPLEDNLGRWQTYFPYNKLASATTPIRTRGFSAEKAVLPSLDIQTSPTFLNEDQTLQWESGQRIYMVTTPLLQSVTGDLANQTDLDLGDMILHSASADGVISWMSLGAEPAHQSEISILSINSRIKNSGMIWEGNETVRDQWGQSPTLIQPLEVNLSLHISADSVHVYPLNTLGAEGKYFTALPDETGFFSLNIDQNELQTPWFGIHSFLSTTSAHSINAAALQFKMYPNPSKGPLIARWNKHSLHEAATIGMYSCQGKRIKEWILPTNKVLLGEVELQLSDIVPGIYLVTLTTGDIHWTTKLVKL
ncbi:MAG: T9SS type A sorting domain-containing protein [Saprospiraceae bacterium]|nr:T9SS type A sorting domain-containing protein [Saprospiraceae bacterium]